jgi:transposase
MSTGKRHSYDKQFKLSAVKMIVEGGMRVSQVSRDLGINENSIHKWKRDYLSDQQNAFPGKRKMKPGEQEFRQLEKELRSVKVENEVL